jgi:hypothetical protein
VNLLTRFCEIDTAESTSDEHVKRPMREEPMADPIVEQTVIPINPAAAGVIQENEHLDRGCRFEKRADDRAGTGTTMQSLYAKIKNPKRSADA